MYFDKWIFLKWNRITIVYDASKLCWHLWNSWKQLFLSFIIISFTASFFTFKCGKIDHLTQTFLSWTSANFAYIIIDIFFTLTRAFIGNFISMPIRYVPTRIRIKYKIIDYNGIIFAVFPVNHFCSKSSHYVEEEEDKICCLESCRIFWVNASLNYNWKMLVLNNLIAMFKYLMLIFNG